MKNKTNTDNFKSHWSEDWLLKTLVETLGQYGTMCYSLYIIIGLEEPPKSKFCRFYVLIDLS